MRDRTTLLLLLLLSTAMLWQPVNADRIPEQDWQTMQAAQDLLRSQDWLHTADIAPLLTTRDALSRLVAHYGPVAIVATWLSGRAIPESARDLNLQDDAAVAAYNNKWIRLSRAEMDNTACVVRAPLSELLAQAQGIVGLRTDDPVALRYAVQWVEDFITEKRRAKPGNRIATYGIPMYYYSQCRERLIELESVGGTPAVSPVAFLGSTYVPLRLAQADGQLFMPISSLGIPQSRVKWDAETKTATLDLARHITLASSRSVAEVDGSPVKLSAPPIIEDGRLMISVRDVKPLFGLDYKWDPKLWAVRIFAPES